MTRLHDETERNREIAEGFLRLAGSQNRPREAYEKYVAPGFVHHNPHFPGGRDDLLRAMEADAKEHPNKAVEVQTAVAEGDLVAVHSHVRQDTAERDFAAVHIFRIRDGKIVELWDVVQQVPQDSPNANGMF